MCPSQSIARCLDKFPLTEHYDYCQATVPKKGCIEFGFIAEALTDFTKTISMLPSFAFSV